MNELKWLLSGTALCWLPASVNVGLFAAGHVLEDGFQRGDVEPLFWITVWTVFAVAVFSWATREEP